MLYRHFLYLTRAEGTDDGVGDGASGMDTEYGAETECAIRSRAEVLSSTTVSGSGSGG